MGKNSVACTLPNASPLFALHYVPIGLARWEQARENWLVQKSDTDSTSKAAVPLHVDEVIDIIFSPRWRNQGDDEGPPPRFPQNVPLPQMVDVLVDLWEAEGTKNPREEVHFFGYSKVFTS